MTAPSAPGTPLQVPPDVPLAAVLRGDHLESLHVGAVAVVRADGRTWTAGGADLPVWMRSAVKPFQALPLLERGIADRLGLGDAELAVVGASHDGTERHVAVVVEILRRAGLDESALGCGPHAPSDKRSAVELARSGGKPQRIHNNCSGKHAGFLLLAQDLGAPLDRYLEPDAPGQTLVRDAIAAVTGARLDDVAIDGCGAPTYRMSLTALATGFCRLVNPAPLGDVRAGSCERLLRAITAEPALQSGESRLCAALIRAAPGSVYPKNGAEGIYACGIARPTGAVGIAVKVRDGAARGYEPVIVQLLTELGVWPQVPATLAERAEVPILNTQRRVVGAVRSVFDASGLRQAFGLEPVGASRRW